MAHTQGMRVLAVLVLAASATAAQATEARAGDGAALAIVAVGRDGKKKVVFADPAAAPLRLGGRAVPDRERRDLATLGAAVQWSIVEPHGFRARPSANGATSDFYSNVSTERTDFGRWLGYDRIDYFATVVRDWAPAASISAEVRSGDPDAIQIDGAGSPARCSPAPAPRRSTRSG
jgi:hypothetical protein